jgi:hypothetical protein
MKRLFYSGKLSTGIYSFRIQGKTMGRLNWRKTKFEHIPVNFFYLTNITVILRETIANRVNEIEMISISTPSFECHPNLYIYPRLF